MPRWIKKITTRQENLRVTLSAIHDQPWDWWGWKTSSVYIALFTRYKLTRVRPGLKLTRVSFCRVNTANPGSTRVSLEKCRVNTTWVSFNPGRTRVSLCRIKRAYVYMHLELGKVKITAGMVVCDSLAY